MPIKCRVLDRMSRNDDAAETMPANLRFDSRAVPCLYIPVQGADSGFVSMSVSRESSFSSTEQDAAALSRNSSFSSSSGGSTLDTDSPVSRNSSWRSIEADDSLKEQQRRRLRAARTKYKNASHCTLPTNQEDEPTSGEYNAIPTPPARPTLLAHGRSSSVDSEMRPVVPKSRLSVPEALVISTPSGMSFMQYRNRSRSWNYDSPRGDGVAPKSTDRSERNLTEERNKLTGSMECLPSLQRSSNAPKLTQGTAPPPLDAEKQLQQVDALRKERDELRRERDEFRRERDRFKCERDAIELERDALLREKEELERELDNRSSIILHMQDHIKSIPVAREELKPPVKQRSKSEVKRPVLFFPEESNAANINAYTCL